MVLDALASLAAQSFPLSQHSAKKAAAFTPFPSCLEKKKKKNVTQLTGQRVHARSYDLLGYCFS